MHLVNSDQTIGVTPSGSLAVSVTTASVAVLGVPYGILGVLRGFLRLDSSQDERSGGQGQDEDTRGYPPLVQVIRRCHGLHGALPLLKVDFMMLTR